jgi:phosphoglycerate dehydrogenase-like enzyme
MSTTSIHDRQDPLIAIASDSGRNRFSAVQGSPLDGRARTLTVEWTAGMSDDERADALDSALTHADALVVAPWIHRMPRFDDARWQKAPRLKVIAGTFDNRFAHWIDVADAQQRGLALIDTSRSMTPTVAEFALAMILNLMRDIPTAIDLVRRGEWTTGNWDQDGFVYGDLTGRAVGLAGFGSINRRLAELLVPFHGAVATCDPYVADFDLNRFGVARAGSLVELARESEIFVVGIPPTPSTQGIISREVVDALNPGSLFVLVTRMAVVDQSALWRRAELGEIRAAIDVYEPEPPPPDASFRTSPFVLPTPHIAGNTFICHRRCFTTACDDALAVLEGRKPVYPVTVRDDLLYQGRPAFPE